MFYGSMVVLGLLMVVLTLVFLCVESLLCTSISLKGFCV